MIEIRFTLNGETVSISTRGNGLHILYDETDHSLWAAPESRVWKSVDPEVITLKTYLWK